MFAKLLLENSVPAGCAMFWLAAGVVERFPVPLPPPHAPQLPEEVPLPTKQLPAVADPVPNSLAGTSPATRSAFAAIPVSTYCLVDACIGAAGFAGSVIGPVIVPPAVGR